MTHTIEIKGIELRAPHGCFEVERQVGGNFTVDITLEVEDGGAAAADDIALAVNYVEVYETVREQMAIPSHIIENAALRIVEAVLGRFPRVAHVGVTLSKLAPPLGGKARKVSVTISAGRT